MWPIQFAFGLRISCRIFLCSLTLSNTSSFITWSVQMIFSILLQHHISKCPLKKKKRFSILFVFFDETLWWGSTIFFPPIPWLSCCMVRTVRVVERFWWSYLLKSSSDVFTGASRRKARDDSMDSSASSWGVDAFYILTNKYNSEVHTSSIHVFRAYP